MGSIILSVVIPIKHFDIFSFHTEVIIFVDAAKRRNKKISFAVNKEKMQRKSLMGTT